MKKILKNPILIGFLILALFAVLSFLTVHIGSLMITHSWSVTSQTDSGAIAFGVILGALACALHFPEEYDGSGPENKDTSHPLQH
jgi:hypothetical protein